MLRDNDIKQSAIKGLGWSLGGSLASYGITFLVGVVLARLLTPAEYGLIGIITIFITVFNGIIDSGFSNALIRKQNVSEEDNNTVFVSNLGIAIILFFALYYFAIPISAFFNDSRLIPLTRVMGICLIINAFSIIQIALLTKDLDFKTQTYCSFISSLISGLIGVALAFCDYGVWALVWQQLSQKALNTVLLWKLRKWRPKLIFSIQSFRDLFGFGWKLMVSGILNNIWSQIYQIVIGKCYSPSTLGQYTKAREYVNLVSMNLTSVIQRVSYPTLSKIQDDGERLRNGYRKIIRMSAFVVFTCCMGMAGSAKQLILVLIGEQWLPCVPMMQIICFSMALFPIHAINLNMLQVQGRSDLFLKLEIIKKILGLIPLTAGILLNIYWMLIIGFLTGGCIDFFLNSHYSGRMICYSSLQQLRDLSPSIIISIGLAIIVFFIGLLPWSEFIVLPIQIVIGFTFVIFWAELFQLPEYKEIKEICTKIANKQ